jgi:GNAT superfamily N-acetyltransferase
MTRSNDAPEMQIRPACTDDLPSLDKMAYRAKAHWGYAAEQLECWRPDLTVERATLGGKPVFVAEVGARLAGFLQLAMDTQPWEIWAMFVEPACMGRGFGRQLVEHAKSLAAAAGVSELAIDADPNAEGFYLACGAYRIGELSAPIDGQPGRVRPQLLLATGGGLSAAERAELVALEEAMWREATRFDSAFQEARFAPDFFEIGRSGRVFRRAQIISSTPHPIAATLPLPGLQLRMLDADTVQITYNSRVVHGGRVEHARRSSIWSRTAAGWKMRFHQGTPCEPPPALDI